MKPIAGQNNPRPDASAASIIKPTVRASMRIAQRFESSPPRSMTLRRCIHYRTSTLPQRLQLSAASGGAVRQHGNQRTQDPSRAASHAANAPHLRNRRGFTGPQTSWKQLRHLFGLYIHRRLTSVESVSYPVDCAGLSMKHSIIHTWSHLSVWAAFFSNVPGGRKSKSSMTYPEM
jgi:hypothetical protein